MVDGTVEAFAAKLEAQQGQRLAREYPTLVDLYARTGQYKAEIHPGPKYTRVDFDHSGKYMVVNATGEIFGVKGYGVIHRGHYYGTLDTVDAWDWSSYYARPRR